MNLNTFFRVRLGDSIVLHKLPAFKLPQDEIINYSVFHKDNLYVGLIRPSKSNYRSEDVYSTFVFSTTTYKLTKMNPERFCCVFQNEIVFGNEYGFYSGTFEIGWHLNSRSILMKIVPMEMRLVALTDATIVWLDKDFKLYATVQFIRIIVMHVIIDAVAVGDDLYVLSGDEGRGIPTWVSVFDNQGVLLKKFPMMRLGISMEWKGYFATARQDMTFPFYLNLFDKDKNIKSQVLDREIHWGPTKICKLDEYIAIHCQNGLMLVNDDEILSYFDFEMGEERGDRQGDRFQKMLTLGSVPGNIAYSYPYLIVDRKLFLVQKLIKSMLSPSIMSNVAFYWK